MSITTELATAAKIKAISRGSMCLVAVNDAIKLLDSAFERQLTVVGVEGFYIRGSSIVPDMSAVADFSELAKSEAAVNVSHQQARLFIESIRSSELYLEFEFQE